MKKLLLNSFVLLSLLCLLFSYSMTPLASAQLSGCAEIPVGSPPPNQQVPAGCAGGASQDLVKAGEDLKNAYGACQGGKTRPASGQDPCDIPTKLKQDGYSDKQIAAFTSLRSATIVPSTNCTQCLGFVALAVALLNGDSSGFAGMNSAAQAAAKSSIVSGQSTYVQTQGPPQAGDIGLSPNWGVGHALIVKSVESSSTKYIKFTAIEANWVPCQATDDQPHVTNADYPDFIFFRKK